MSADIDTYALVSLEEAKNYLLEDPVANLDVKEDLIIRLINGVSAACETYMNRKIMVRTYTEDYDGQASDTLQIKSYPIVSLTSVCVDEDRVFPSTKNIDLSDIVIYAEEGKLRRRPTGLTVHIDEETGRIIKTSVFGFGKKNIRVVYSAGYTIAPSDIKHAVCEELVWHYENVTKKKLGVTGVSAAGEHTSTYIGDILPTTKMILSAYRRVLL